MLYVSSVKNDEFGALASLIFVTSVNKIETMIENSVWF